MKHWDELRTAHAVVVAGTITEAANSLGVHRATVIRHINSLEEKLDTTLFIRESSGYAPTDACYLLTKTVSEANEQFERLYSVLKGDSHVIKGILRITTINGLEQMFTPIVADFKCQNPGCKVDLSSTPKLLQIEHGEAHIALRAGPKPAKNKDIVLYQYTVHFRLHASKSYVSRFGIPQNQTELAEHFFVANTKSPITSFENWIRSNVPMDKIALDSATPSTLLSALRDGVGVGFMPVDIAPNNDDLVQLPYPTKAFPVPVWLMINKPASKTEKVQSFMNLLLNRYDFQLMD